MRSSTTRRFRELFANLPEPVRFQAVRAYRLFRINPMHPGLRFKKVDDDPDTYSVRVGLGHRALGVLKGDEITWYWIGPHDEYDRLV